MENPFTLQDNLIDIAGSFFFLLIIVYIIYAIGRMGTLKNGDTKIVIVLMLFVIISGLHIYQIATQVFHDGFASFRVWDFINYLTALGMLGATQLQNRS